MAKMMKRDDFEYLVRMANGYDNFPEYIDNYKQYEEACERNGFISGEWNEVMHGYGLNIGLYSFTNLGGETETKLQEAIEKAGVSIEPKRFTKEDLAEKIKKELEKRMDALSWDEKCGAGLKLEMNNGHIVTIVQKTSTWRSGKRGAIHHNYWLEVTCNAWEADAKRFFRGLEGLAKSMAYGYIG